MSSDARRSATIGVLVLDSIDEPHRSIAGDYPELFDSLLRRDTLDVEFYDGRAPELPDPTTCDGWLLPGSRSSVNEEHEWLPALRSWTDEVVNERRPLAGVCFGHQLIAQILGAPVGKANVGWNIGAIDYEVRSEAASASLDTDRFTLLASHQDQVHELPAGATLIASAPRCPVAAYAVDDHILCVQAHPEWVPSMAASLYQSRIDRIGRTEVDTALASLNAPLDRHLVAEWLTSSTRRAIDPPS